MMEACLLEEGLGAKQGWTPKPWGSSTYTRTAAHRKTLLDIMTGFIPADTVRFKKRVTRVSQFNCHVELTFADGETARASAVIACDGIKGFTRRYVLRTEHPDKVLPKYGKQYAYRATVPIDHARMVVGHLADDAKMYLGSDANLSTYVISEGREINVVGFVRDKSNWPDSNKVTREVTKNRMIADFTEQNIDSRLLKLLNVGLLHHFDRFGADSGIEGEAHSMGHVLPSKDLDLPPRSCLSLGRLCPRRASKSGCWCWTMP